MVNKPQIDKRPVLVVGVTGQPGTRVVQQLSAAHKPVRAFVRTTSRQDHLRLPGVQLVHGDLRDAASIADACKGAFVPLRTPD